MKSIILQNLNIINFKGIQNKSVNSGESDQYILV